VATDKHNSITLVALWAAIIVVATLWPLVIEPLLLGPQSKPEENVIQIGGQRSWQGVIETASPILKGVFVFGGVVSLGVCATWYFFSKRLARNRSRFLSAMGFTLFLVGSLIPFLAFGHFVQSKAFWAPLVAAGRAPTFVGAWWQRPITRLVLSLLLSAIVIVIAYFLHFARPEKNHRTTANN
jgi:hypothetical protein